jgi:hypothetical protein
MRLSVTGEVLRAAVQVPRCPGDAETLLLEVRDAKSKETLKLVCSAPKEMRESLFLAADNSTERPMVTLSLQATQMSLAPLTNGRVYGVVYRLLVDGVIEGRPSVRLQATQAKRQPRPL